LSDKHNAGDQHSGSGFKNPVRVKTDLDSSNGYTVYTHFDCGKLWQEKPDDEHPNYCPGCGDEL